MTKLAQYTIKKDVQVVTVEYTYIVTRLHTYDWFTKVRKTLIIERNDGNIMDDIVAEYVAEDLESIPMPSGCSNKRLYEIDYTVYSTYNGCGYAVWHIDHSDILNGKFRSKNVRRS